MERLTILRGRWWEIALLCLIFLVISHDDHRDWDENTYLARAAYSPIGRLEEWILPGRAEWELEWYQVKVAHLCLLHGLFRIFGLGPGALFSVTLAFALLVLGAGGLLFGILREIFGESAPAREASILALTSPLALYLSYKAVTETTAIFFLLLSVWLFLRSWRARGATRCLLSLGSALAFLAATASRIESVVGFYAFGLALAAYRPRDAFPLIRRYAAVTMVLIAALLGYRFLTGINPYAAIDSQAASHSSRLMADNLLNTLASAGFLLIPVLLSLRRPAPALRFGLVLYLVPLLAVLAAFRIVHLRHLFLALPGLGVLSYLGLARCGEWMESGALKTARPAVLSLLVTALLLGDRFVELTLGEVGLEEKDLAAVLDRAREEGGDPLILVDSPTNIFAYLRVAYPNLRVRLTISGLASDPLPVAGTDDLRREAAGRPAFYVDPYHREMNWAEKLVRLVRGGREGRGGIGPKSWLKSSGEVDLLPIFSRGRYKLYRVGIAARTGEP